MFDAWKYVLRVKMWVEAEICNGMVVFCFTGSNACVKGFY